VSPSAILAQPADQVPIVSLDFETTGLHVESGHRVIEVGVVRLEPQSGRREAFSTLIHPGGPISRRTQAIHGITDEMVAGAPRFPSVLPQLAPLIEGAVFIAHNAPFDLGFLRAESKWAGLPMPEPAAVVDTLSLARHVFRLPSCSLSSVAARIGLPFHGAHRALADARAVVAIYREMVANISPDSQTVPTIGDLLTLVEEAKTERSQTHIRSTLAAAQEAGQPVSIDYTSYKQSGTLVTRRVITVLKLKRRKVDAFCHLRDARRTFRLDRIRNITPAASPQAGSAAAQPSG
jgi:DNA polymerase III epsilon subunit family exonuclease